MWESLLSGVVGQALPWLGAGIGALFGADDMWKGLTGSGLTSSEIQQNEFNADQARITREFNAEQAQIQRDWQTQMDNTKYQRGVADMSAAGINPAMLMGGSGLSGSTPSGATASGPAASGSGGQRNAAASLSAMMELGFAKQRFDMNKAQIDLLHSENDVKRAEEARLKEETAGIHIDNEYRAEFNRLRNEGQELQNGLTGETIGRVRSEIRKIDVEAISESYDIPLKEAQTLKANMDAYNVAEMLPYNKAVADATVTEKKSQAQYAFVQAAFQQGLIDEGYISNMCRSMGAEADYQEWLTAVKTGDPEGKVYQGKFAQFIGRTSSTLGAMIESTQIGQILNFGISNKVK